MKQVVSHLIITKSDENHYHMDHTGDMSDVNDLLHGISAEVPLLTNALTLSGQKAPESVLFKNKMRIGDIIALTATIRDFKTAYPETKVAVETDCQALWDYNPYVSEVENPEVVVDIGPKKGTNKSNTRHLHLTDAFRMCAEERLGISIPAGECKPDLWMSEEEFNAPSPIDEPYWILTVGCEPGWPAKLWPFEYWQEVINTSPVRFVQAQKLGDPFPVMDGVIDYTGRTENIRDLMKLFLHAEGSAGLVSMHMHMSAAFDKPCVVVAGAREPPWFTQYMGHQYIQNCGAVACSMAQNGYQVGGCWKCSTEACDKRREQYDMGEHTCMSLIRPEEVAGAIDKYSKGKRTSSTVYFKEKVVEVHKPIEITAPPREINVLASLSSKGGGEQSACKVAGVLRDAGWKVNLYPWDSVHENFTAVEKEPYSFKEGMASNMAKDLPLLFYANDQINDFCDSGKSVVDQASDVAIAINWINGALPKSLWLKDKLRAVLFQNTEKLGEWERDASGFNGTKLLVQPGAIDLDTFLSLPIRHRKPKDRLVVLKHCVNDPRKYVTQKSFEQGEKIHAWQKCFKKELDVDLYSRLLKNMDDVQFEFMEAPQELVDAFKNEPRMVFYEWNAMPVEEFLARGHVYLYRTSNQWRDQYPRVVGEALAAGLPVITEPRDGTKDRVQHGETGFHCVDYDGYQYALKTLRRKEEYRQKMGENARRWARKHLDPVLWVGTLDSVLE